MRSVMSIQRSRPVPGIVGTAAVRAWRHPAVSASIAGAWLIAIGAQLTGNAALLHHHSLIEGGPPLWLGVPLFLLGWQVMVTAMMLPASLPTIGVARAAMQSLPRPRLAELVFVAAFAFAWAVFGLLAFAGDFVLHRTVDATPWLAARPWLIEASVLALAGAYQFAPLKRRSLAACRHPVGLVPAGTLHDRGWFRLGLDHGLACLGSSWALMLLMFAEGFANLWWMAALTGLMVYEATGRHGGRAASVAGIVLLLAGLTVLSGPLAIGA
jgi:predicted metal-binding membrane protein